MRTYSEPTMKNLLRRSLVMGVPLNGLLVLVFVVLALMIFAAGSKVGNLFTVGVSIFGYVGLRVCARFMKNGWEEELVYPIERFFTKKTGGISISECDSEIEVMSHDTFEQSDLIYEKEKVVDALSRVDPKKDRIFSFKVGEQGTKLNELSVEGIWSKECSLQALFPDIERQRFCYTLCNLPVTTTPISISTSLSRLRKPFQIIIRTTGVEFNQAKAMIESSRRSNVNAKNSLSNIDSEVTFEEASKS